MESDGMYFRRRALEERFAALKADDPNARRAHREMAARYDDLAGAIIDRTHPDDRTGMWL